MKIHWGRSSEKPLERGDGGGGSLVLKNELVRYSVFSREPDPVPKVWWINTVCLMVFSVALIGFERVTPFMPRATAGVPLPFQLPVLDTDVVRTSEEPLESKPTPSEDAENRAVPQVPEPLKIEEFGKGGTADLDPLPIIQGDGDEGKRRVPVRGGDRSGGAQETGEREGNGKAKPEVFTGRGKRGTQGYVPEPDISDMPNGLRDLLPRGKVTMKLRFRVSLAGKIVAIHVDESSGNGALDRFIMEWYRRKATFVGASEERDFVETLSLRLPE